MIAKLPIVNQLIATLAFTSLLVLPSLSTAQEWWSTNTSNGQIIFRNSGGGKWTEYQSGQARHQFQEVQRTDKYVWLSDSTRGIGIALYSDQCMIQHGNGGGWVRLYSGAWSQGGGGAAPAAAYKVRLISMYVVDDKEGGSGDWRLTGDVGNRHGIAFIDNREAGSGQTIPINSPWYPLTQQNPRVRLMVQEHDGGIGAKWEFVGQKIITINPNAPGFQQTRLSNNEGDVVVYLEVQRQ